MEAALHILLIGCAVVALAWGITCLILPKGRKQVPPFSPPPQQAGRSWVPPRPAPLMVPLPAAPPMPPVQAPREDGIRYLGDLQRLEARPDDLFVLSVPGAVSVEGRKAIQRTWEAAGMTGRRLMVLERGMELGIVNTPRGPSDSGSSSSSSD